MRKRSRVTLSERERRVLVEQNLDLVPRLARVMARPFYGSDLEYILSDGYIALAQAVTRYNPTHPSRVSFRMFACKPVRGAVTDSIRRQRRARGWLRTQGGDGRARHVVAFESLERKVRGEAISLDVPDQGPDPLAQVMGADLVRLFARVPLWPRERQVLTGIAAGHQQEAIAKALGIGETWVSALKLSGIAKVRAYLKEKTWTC